MIDIATVILVSGIVGARLLHVAMYYKYYMANPIEIIMLTKGGLAFYGGLLCSIVCGAVYFKKNSIDFWKASDLVSPFLPLAQVFGRLGCFMNGCCYGKLVCPNIFSAVIFPGDKFYRYPTQVYEACTLVILYMILRYMFEKGILKENLILVYLLLYSFQRFLIEFLRDDVGRIAFNLTVSQIISVFIFVISLWLLIRRKINWKVMNLL